MGRYPALAWISVLRLSVTVASSLANQSSTSGANLPRGSAGTPIGDRLPRLLDDPDHHQKQDVERLEAPRVELFRHLESDRPESICSSRSTSRVSSVDLPTPGMAHEERLVEARSPGTFEAQRHVSDLVAPADLVEAGPDRTPAISGGVINGSGDTVL